VTDERFEQLKQYAQTSSFQSDEAQEAMREIERLRALVKAFRAGA
jgi:hypothetical protein